MTGARSIPALVAWMTGVSPRNAETIATIAHRVKEFPKCAAGMREGRFSLDQVGVIAAKAADGSDVHYAEMAAVATVNQLSKAIKLEPKPEPEPRPEPPPRSISKTGDEQSTTYKITLPHEEAAIVDAALDSHRDALITAVETRPHRRRRRQRGGAGAADAQHRRWVHEPGRGRVGR